MTDLSLFGNVAFIFPKAHKRDAIEIVTNSIDVRDPGKSSKTVRSAASTQFACIALS